MINRLSAVLLLGALATAALAADPPIQEPPSMSPLGGYGMVGPRNGMAGPGPRDYGTGPEGAAVPPLPTPFAGVQFTAAQRKTISKMMAKEREAHRKRIAVMQQAQATLRKLYQADTWDTRAIIKVYDKIFAAERNTIEAMAQARNRVYGMLSEAQRAQMRHAQQQRMNRFAPPPRP
jgi:hypothetical protein